MIRIPLRETPISPEIRMQRWRPTRYDSRDAANSVNRTRLGTTAPESRGPVGNSSAALVCVTEDDGVAVRGTDEVVSSREHSCLRQRDGRSARAGSFAALRVRENFSRRPQGLEWHSPAISCSSCCRATAESSGLAHSPDIRELGALLDLDPTDDRPSTTTSADHASRSNCLPTDDSSVRIGVMLALMLER